MDRTPYNHPIYLSGWVARKSVRLYVDKKYRCHYLAMLGHEPPQTMSLASISGRRDCDMEEWKGGGEEGEGGEEGGEEGGGEEGGEEGEGGGGEEGEGGGEEGEVGEGQERDNGKEEGSTELQEVENKGTEKAIVVEEPHGEGENN